MAISKASDDVDENDDEDDDDKLLLLLLLLRNNCKWFSVCESDSEDDGDRPLDRFIAFRFESLNSFSANFFLNRIYKTIGKSKKKGGGDREDDL